LFWYNMLYQIFNGVILVLENLFRGGIFDGAFKDNNPYTTLLKQPPLSIGQVIGVVFMFF
ncbi:hypothetical protein, partial [Leuconostoc mesenteroides]|uniref:hypothetical protein n=1 Tax=Leuconostoc mesenteroides TaxID=1245 RepID=UPI00235E460F